MQDKPQTGVPETPTNFGYNLLGYIIENHHDHSDQQVKICSQQFIQKLKKVSEALESLGDATSIHFEIERNKVNRLLFWVPEQLLHTLAERGAMIPKYTTYFLRNLGLNSILPWRTG